MVHAGANRYLRSHADAQTLGDVSTGGDKRVVSVVRCEFGSVQRCPR